MTELDILTTVVVPYFYLFLVSVLFADSISKLLDGFLRKSGHAHYSMFFVQHNAPLDFGSIMLGSA